MKKNRNKWLVAFLLFASASYAQIAIFNYNTFPTNGCDVFGSIIPFQGYFHQTNAGDINYASSNGALKLTYNYNGGSNNQKGSEFSIFDFNFKPYYKYKVKITAKNSGSYTTPTGLKCNFDAVGINPSCDGNTFVSNNNLTFSNNQFHQPVNGTNFTVYTFESDVLTISHTKLSIGTFTNGSILNNEVLQTIYIQKIEIIEIPPPPIFTLLATPTIVECGSTTPVNFKVTNEYNSPGTLSYNWSTSGWKKDGVIVDLFTTTTNSISLVPNSYPPSMVSVTPVLNNVSQQTKTANVALSSFTTTASITGNDIICLALSSSAIYNISNIETGSSIIWTSSNPTIATISSPTNNQVIVNGLSQGTFDLIANITNSCGQQKPITKSIRIGNPSAPSDILGFCCNGMEFGSESIYEFTVNDSNNQGVNQFDWVVAGGTMLEGQGTNTIFVKTSKVEGTQILYFDVSVRVGNNCGLSSYLWRSGYVTSGVGPAMFTIYPNPSTETVNLELRDKNDQSVKDSEISGELFDFLGYSKGKIKINDFKAIINVSGLTKGIYVLKINIDGHIESHQIIVQ